MTKKIALNERNGWTARHDSQCREVLFFAHPHFLFFKEKRNSHPQNTLLQAAILNEKKIEWSTGRVVSGYLDYQCGILYFGNRAKVIGRIIEWRDNKILLQIIQYIGEKKRVIKCNDIKNDIVTIDNYENFRLEE